jgi:GDP-L-fucose synthase
MKKNFWQGKKVLVTGGRGFLGTHLVARLKKEGAKLSVPTSKQFDLRIKENCQKVVKGHEMVIHLAAKVGGIGFNNDYPAEMYYDNILMGTHLMEAARIAGVKKFVALGTICAYPKFTPVPFREEDIWNGYPEETNAPYGLAKKMLLVQAQAYRQQYGFNAIFLLPVNMYGPGDKYDPSVSHVIPALIKKAVDAKQNGDKTLVVWGTGKPTREFLYVEDAVTGILMAAEKYNKKDPINIGSGYEVSIKKLIGIICKLVGFKGKIVFDASKPDGQPRRKLDSSKAFKEFGFRAKANFIESLEETIASYYANEQKNK